ncbi:MAG: CapA family protein [Candidatus Saccharibacteria bacterium]|nr:CapA family protein [Candidatus Saccharibacteria bacterium]
MKKIALIVLVALVAGGLVFTGWWFAIRDDSTEMSEQPESGQSETEADDGLLRIVATGDMIAHDSINENARQDDGSYDYLSLMSDMQPFFQQADVRFCNQATAAGGERLGISGYPVFNAPFAFTQDMVKVGCNVVNLASNHINDKGKRQIDATVAEWERQDGVLAYAGANRSAEEQAQLRTFTVDGVSFGFLAYTTYSNNQNLTPYGLNMYDSQTAQQEISAARDEVDFVIVSMRWGTEYSTEINTEQNEIAQEVVNAGADFVFGHGPHVLQPVKRIADTNGREGIVWFSLGNFLNSQIDIETLIGGFAIIDINQEELFVENVEFMPVYQHYEWTAQQREEEDLLSRHNFSMVPLDQADELLRQSTHDTTVEAQTQWVQQILNRYIEVPVIGSDEY